MSDEKPAAVIFGATGNQGSSVLKHLYAGGSFEIFAVTRDVTNARSLQLSQVFPGVKLLPGDFEDKDSLAGAMRGPRAPGSTRQVVVFFASTPCLASSGYAVDADKETLTGLALIEAAVETKVNHVVFSSIANCDRKGAPSYHRSKHRIEERLKKSGLSHTIIRPVSFLEIWARLSQFSNVSISGLVKGQIKQQWVALDDLGACAALALQVCHMRKGKKGLQDSAKYKGQTLDLCGDELTGDAMAETLTKLREKDGGEKIGYKCAWFMRLFMMYFVRSIFEEKVQFQEEGGFAADRKALASMSEVYPDAFKRKGVITFERFLMNNDLNSKPLPPEKGWGKTFTLVVGVAVGLVLTAAYLLPASLWEHVKSKWAFYSFLFLMSLGVLNKGLGMLCG